MEISILGSCVTRDAFALHKEEFEVKEYFARTSFISLASSPIEVKKEELKCKSNFRLNCVYDDIIKSLYSNVSIMKGKYFIIDFIDERFNLVRVDNTILTYSNELIESEYLNGKEYTILNRKDVDVDFWKESADIFISEISKRYNSKQIILHKAFLADKYRDGEKIYDFDDEEKKNVKELNKVLDVYYDYIINNIPEINVIEIDDRVADKNHKWGLAPCHYTKEYYEMFIMKVKDIIEDNKIFPGERMYPAIKPIKYVFQKAKFVNLDKLLIVFSAFNSVKVANYNYVRTLNKYDCNKLFILDDYGDIGTYYIGRKGNFDIETSVISLITDIMAKNNIAFKDVITIGSSKGGTAAFYYGGKYNFGTVIAGAFQYKFGSYVATLKDKSVAKAIMGEISESNILKYDSILRKTLKENKNTEYNIIAGEGDWQFKPFLLDVFKELEKNNIDYNLKLIDIVNHNDIGKYFPEYIDSILDKRLKKLYKVIINEGNKCIKLELYSGTGIKTAFYLVNKGKKVDVINYGDHENIYFDIKESGEYRIDLFFLLGKERICIQSENYYINIGE